MLNASQKNKKTSFKLFFYKKYYVLSDVLGVVFALFLNLIPLHARNVEQQVLELNSLHLLLQTLQNVSSAQELCHLENFWRKQVTFRSLQDKTCHHPLIAALAELLCLPENVHSYHSSNCHRYAYQALGPLRAQEVLWLMLARNDRWAVRFVCQKDHYKKMPQNIQNIADRACPAQANTSAHH